MKWKNVQDENSGYSYSMCYKMVHVCISQLSEIWLQLWDMFLVSDKPQYVEKFSVYSIPQNIV